MSAERIQHAERVARHRDMMILVAAPMTRDNLTRLADARAKSARKLRGDARPIARYRRQSAIESARAFYALARRASQ
jgi:hypothetical protein